MGLSLCYLNELIFSRKNLNTYIDYFDDSSQSISFPLGSLTDWNAWYFDGKGTRDERGTFLFFSPLYGSAPISNTTRLLTQNSPNHIRALILASLVETIYVDLLLGSFLSEQYNTRVWYESNFLTLHKCCKHLDS